jgi:hypothetical protein
MIYDHRGMSVKPAVKATIERIYQHSGCTFGDGLTVTFSGATAGVRRSTDNRVHIIMPAIDELAVVSRELFSDLIAYSVHELGHLWHTDMKVWDDAVKVHGGRVGQIINGLEDPRIELAVVRSGIAPAARGLFERLLNRVLKKSGHVKPDDFLNIPFLLAVEGRRLNGYNIVAPSVVDASPWRNDLVWALNEAHTANCTADIVNIAIELDRRLHGKQGGEQGGQDGQDGQDGQEGKDNADSEHHGEPGRGSEQRKVELTDVIEEECKPLSTQKGLSLIGNAHKKKIIWRS